MKQMVRRLEDKLISSGITKLDRVLAIGMYIVYLLWFSTRLRDWVPPVDPEDLAFLWADIMNTLLASVGLVLAVRHHFWLERVAAQLLGASTFLQTLVLTIFLTVDGADHYQSNMLLGLALAFYFNMRAFGLSVRILRARDALELKLKTPGELQ